MIVYLVALVPQGENCVVNLIEPRGIFSTAEGAAELCRAIGEHNAAYIPVELDRVYEPDADLPSIFPNCTHHDCAGRTQRASDGV